MAGSDTSGYFNCMTYFGFMILKRSVSFAAGIPENFFENDEIRGIFVYLKILRDDFKA